MNSSTSRLYRRVATHLQAGGWARWTFRTRNGKRCLVQALLDELGLHQDLPTDVLDDLNEELSRRQDYRNICARFMCYGIDTQTMIIRWNDSLGRRVGDVIAVLDSLADRLDAERRRPLEELSASMGDYTRQLASVS